MNRPFWYAATALLLFLLALLLWLIRLVPIPFLLALILAYFLNPAVDRLQRRLPPFRGIALVLVPIHWRQPRLAGSTGGPGE